MISQFLTAAAAIGLLGAGIAASGETRSFEALTASVAAASPGMCRVDVVRTGAAGSAEIIRQEFTDGSCACVITTGPVDNNGAAEAIVSNLLSERKCVNAPVAVASPAKAGGLGAIGSLLAAGAGTGAVVAVADSPG